MLYTLPFGTEFCFDETSRALTLTSLSGLTCGHNGLEDDDSCSGLAVISVGTQRLEGAKLKYSCSRPSEDEFVFSAVDEEESIRWEGRWRFERPFGIISCRAKLTCTGSSPVVVRRALPRWCFSPGDYEVRWQMSQWSGENQGQRARLRGADLHLHGRAARSSVGATPYCVLRDCETGAAVAFHVLPRGNWALHIHSDIISNEAPAAIVEAGLSDVDLAWELSPGESIELPEVLIETLPEGDLQRQGVAVQRYFLACRLPSGLHCPPVVYNGWLYRFTSFTREQLSEQLRAAREVGCEVFIVDAGWFGYGAGWGQVGDWREKPGAPFYGDMASFAAEVRAAGLKFGFWMEPERWVAGVPVRAEHPEWFPRHSVRIDLTQPAAAAYFHQVLSENIRKFGAEYIKLDFNLSVGHDETGKELYEYCSELRRQMLRLREEFPTLVIENCGSGSLRCDLDTATLYDLSFVSDNAHPFETLRIRQGAFRRLLPGRLLNWMVVREAPERRTPVNQCAQVMACTAATWDEAGLFDIDYVLISGLLGVPGFSGDLAGLSAEHRRRLAEGVAFYQANREFFMRAEVLALTPEGAAKDDYEGFLAFQMQSGAVPGTTLVFAFTNGFTRRAVRAFRLMGLAAGATYRVERLLGGRPDEDERLLTGGEVMRHGMRVCFPENMHVRHAAVLYRLVEQPAR